MRKWLPLDSRWRISYIRRRIGKLSIIWTPLFWMYYLYELLLELACSCSTLSELHNFSKLFITYRFFSLLLTVPKKKYKNELFLTYPGSSVYEVLSKKEKNPLIVAWRSNPETAYWSSDVPAPVPVPGAYKISQRQGGEASLRHHFHLDQRLCQPSTSVAQLLLLAEHFFELAQCPQEIFLPFVLYKCKPDIKCFVEVQRYWEVASCTCLFYRYNLMLEKFLARVIDMGCMNKRCVIVPLSSCEKSNLKPPCPYYSNQTWIIVRPPSFSLWIFAFALYTVWETTLSPGFFCCKEERICLGCIPDWDMWSTLSISFSDNRRQEGWPPISTDASWLCDKSFISTTHNPSSVFLPERTIDPTSTCCFFSFA